jgi:predicted ester cyclase
VWNGENPEIADELVSPAYLIHDRAADELHGPELYKTLANMVREGFSDMELTIDASVAEDDKVALRWTKTGTHDGTVFDKEPTGKRVE